MSIYIGKKKINLPPIKEQEVVNPNLLINGDFQVNQKGKEVYYGDDTIDSPFGIRTVDRLYLVHDSNARLYKLENGGLKFKQIGANSDLLISRSILNYVLHQNEIKDIVNKTLTLSIKVNNYVHSGNGIYFSIYQYGSAISSEVTLVNGLNQVTFDMPAVTQSVVPFIVINIFASTRHDEEFDIEYIKLEEGPIATPNIRKPYLEELAACQANSPGNILIYSNPNLLINGDLRINQRGKEVYNSLTTGALYTVDRFKINTTYSTTVTVLENVGINIKVPATDQYTGQRIFEYNLEDKDTKPLLGKVVTFSMNILKLVGTARFRVIMDTNIEYTTNVTASGLFTFTFTVPNDGTNLKLAILNNLDELDLDIEYMKLELGLVATPNILRPYAEELLLCQRYYQAIKVVGGTGTVGNIGVPRNTTTLRFYINLITQMRTIPTTNVGVGGVSSSDISIINLNTGAITAINNDSLSLQCETTNQVALNYNTTNLVLGNIYNLTDNNGNMKLEFDAEIY